MLLLDGANDKIQLVTSGGGAFDTEVQASWVHNNAGTLTPGGDPLASITTAATTEIVGAAGASQQRSVRGLSFRNNHATDAVTWEVQETDGTNTVTLAKIVAAAGESLVYGENGIWVYYDPNGKPYVGLGPIATQAEMESAASTSVMVTPARQHFHPGHPKCWGEFLANSTTILASYNIASVADTATGAMTVTIATDFASANWACQVTRSEDDMTLVYSATYDAKAAGTVILRSVVEAGSGSDPTAASGNASWSMQGQGDHA